VPPAGGSKPGIPRPPTAEGEEQLPKRFGKYTLIRKIAIGGMAEIFLALQRSVAGFEKIIVVKRILPHLAKDAQFVTMLLDEARIAATLNHPNVAQIYDVGQHDGQFYIAMEHVHGEDLRTVVRSMKGKNVTSFPLEHSLAIVLGMAAGLSYAHEQRTLDGEPMNIVHRDVSPQNVLVTFNGDVKLVDFGIAKAGRSNVEDTRSGKLKGKVPYMSPEQAQGLELDARSDVFALGVMLFELTTGRRLFRGANEFETLKMIVEQPYPAPRSINTNIAPRLEQIIQRALEKDVAKRYQSAREMQAELQDFIRHEKLAVSPISLGEWMQMLFAEKLAQQKQLLMEGRQLAEILSLQAAAEEEAERNSLTGSGVRSRRPSRAPWFAVVGVLLAALAGGTFLWMRLRDASRPTGPGVIAVTSTPPGAGIWLDGALQRSRTPTTLRDLPVGAAHSIKLTLEGYRPFAGTVSLSEATPHSTIAATLSRASASDLAVVNVRSTPPGARVLFDGRDTGKTTPATIPEIAPGVEHAIALSLDGWVTKSETLLLTRGQVRDLTVTLERTPLGPNEALVRIVVEPREARVKVGDDWHEGGGPYELRVEARRWRIEIAHSGFRNEEHDVELRGGQVTDVEYHLERERERPTGGGNPTPPPPTASGPGTLTFAATPWCNVTIDGTPAGQTPIVNKQLPAGRHRVVCENPELRLSRTLQIEIVAGQPTRQRISLQ
jgi:serine/threonine-protein kinase